MVSALDVGLIPPTLPFYSRIHFHTSIQLRDNNPGESLSGLTSLGLLCPNTTVHSSRGRNNTLDEQTRDSDDSDEPRNVRAPERLSPADRYLKVNIFSNAQNIFIQDTAIKRAGQDTTIIHNNVAYAYQDPLGFGFGLTGPECHLTVSFTPLSLHYMIVFRVSSFRIVSRSVFLLGSNVIIF